MGDLAACRAEHLHRTTWGRSVLRSALPQMPPFPLSKDSLLCFSKIFIFFPLLTPNEINRTTHGFRFFCRFPWLFFFFSFLFQQNEISVLIWVVCIQSLIHRCYLGCPGCFVKHCTQLFWALKEIFRLGFLKYSIYSKNLLPVPFGATNTERSRTSCKQSFHGAGSWRRCDFMFFTQTWI